MQKAVKVNPWERQQAVSSTILLLLLTPHLYRCHLLPLCRYYVLQKLSQTSIRASTRLFRIATLLFITIRIISLLWASSLIHVSIASSALTANVRWIVRI